MLVSNEKLLQLYECAATLEACGAASLRVSDRQAAAHARGFAAAAAGLDLAHEDPHDLRIHAEVDSASASGVHAAGALSQYNVCREGLIFSNGDTFDICDDGTFADEMATFFATAHGLCLAILAAIEGRLQLPTGWFDQAFGPFDRSSQWHVKRYVPDAAPPQAVTADGKQVLLPVHSDPSLISVIVHDAPGVRPGALGLECLAPRGEWSEVSAHGHGVVTVLVGAVLDKVTGGLYPAAKHRVAAHDPVGLGRRVAATFFFRPSPAAWLVRPPSASLDSRPVRAIRYRDWQAKVASKYERHSRQGGDKKAAAAAAGSSSLASAEIGSEAGPRGKAGARGGSKAAAHKAAWAIAQQERQQERQQEPLPELSEISDESRGALGDGEAERVSRRRSGSGGPLAAPPVDGDVEVVSIDGRKVCPPLPSAPADGGRCEHRAPSKVWVADPEGKGVGRLRVSFAEAIRAYDWPLAEALATSLGELCAIYPAPTWPVHS